MRYLRYFVLAVAFCLVLLYFLLQPLCVGELASSFKERLQGYDPFGLGAANSLEAFYAKACTVQARWIRPYGLASTFLLVALYLFIGLRFAKPGSKQAKLFARGYLVFLLLGLALLFYKALKHHPALDSSSKLIGVLPEKGVYRPQIFLDVGSLDGTEALVTFVPKNLLVAREPTKLPMALPQRCKFSESELLKLSDKEAEWVVWNAMALLRADPLAIVKSAGDRDSEIPEAYARGFLDPQYLDGLVFQTKVCALMRLQSFGAFAVGASDDVFTFLSDLKYSDRAKETLLRIGGPQDNKLSALVGLLYGQDLRLREVAFSLLDALGERAVGVILQELDSDNKEVRENSLRLLIKNGKENEAVLTAFIDATKDARLEVRVLGFLGLKEHKLRSEEVVPLCINALTEVSDQVKIAAIEVLNAYGADGASAALEPLISLVASDRSNARAKAVRAAGSIGKNRPDTARRLVEAVYSDKEIVSLHPSDLKCRLWFPSSAVSRQERWDHQRPFSYVRDATPEVLKEVLVSYGEPLLSEVEVFLGDSRLHVQDLACGAVEALKPKDFGGVGKLRMLLASPSLWVSVSAMRTLLVLEGESEENLTALMELQERTDFRTCLEEGSFLAHLGALGDPVVSSLILAFKEATGHQRCILAGAIKEVFPLKPIRFDEITALAEGIKWHERCVVVPLVGSLSNIRPVDERLLQKLQSLYLGEGFPECKDAVWKESALYALLKLAGAEGSTFEILRKGNAKLSPGRRSYLSAELQKIDHQSARDLVNEMIEADRVDLKKQENRSPGTMSELLWRGEFCPDETGQWSIKKNPSKLHTFGVHGTVPDLHGILKQEGVDVNGYGYGCNTPLIEALKAGRREIAEFLLANGADPNKGNADNTTPVMMAVQVGDRVLLELLLKKGADLNKVNVFGESALTRGLGDRKLSVVKALLQAGADPNSGKSFPTNDSPFMLAVRFGDRELINLFIERSVDFKLTNNTGKTVLHEVASKGDKELYSYLVEKGANPTAIDCSGFTPSEYLEKRKPLRS